ncbi:MAG: PEGA domain-containing protein [Candidatus Acidiferrum sp.]
MLLRFATAVAFMCSLATVGFAQGNPKSPDQHLILEQILTQIYQPSEVGKRLMGVGADADIRRAGTIVVVQHEGLYGSLIRNETASSAIHGLEVKLYRGHQDYTVPVGERYYVTTVHAGSSTVDIGLLSARPVSTSHGAGRVWTIATFYFPEGVLANAEKDTVIREIDQWLIPEGRTGSTGALAAVTSAVPPATVPPPVAAPAVAPTAAAASVTETLYPGMTREQVLAVLGKPQREVTFQTQTWMHYPGMVALLRDGKLASVEQAGPSSTASIALRSEPSGAEIYVDGQLTGSTPSTLEVPSGNHRISMRLAGYEDWVRDVKVLGGSDTQFEGKLEKK